MAIELCRGRAAKYRCQSGCRYERYERPNTAKGIDDYPQILYWQFADTERV